MDPQHPDLTFQRIKADASQLKNTATLRIQGSATPNAQVARGPFTRFPEGYQRQNSAGALVRLTIDLVPKVDRTSRQQQPCLVGVKHNRLQRIVSDDTP